MRKNWKDRIKPTWQGILLTIVFAIFAMLFVLLVELSFEIICDFEECRGPIYMALSEFYSLLNYSTFNLISVSILTIILFYLLISFTINSFKERRKK